MAGTRSYCTHAHADFRYAPGAEQAHDQQWVDTQDAEELSGAEDEFQDDRFLEEYRHVWSKISVLFKLWAFCCLFLLLSLCLGVKDWPPWRHFNTTFHIALKLVSISVSVSFQHVCKQSEDAWLSLRDRPRQSFWSLQEKNASTGAATGSVTDPVYFRLSTAAY